MNFCTRFFFLGPRSPLKAHVYLANKSIQLIEKIFVHELILCILGMTIALEEHISFEKGEELCKTLGTYFIYKYLGLYKLFEGKSYKAIIQSSEFT